MNITEYGITSVAAITIICVLIGMVVKAAGLNAKWIPCIVGVCGAALGVAGMTLIPDFPAVDYITAAAVGVVSGLASTGAHQIVKQLNTTDT
jgi:hypothetical protein